jgi:hypothetical protein
MLKCVELGIASRENAPYTPVFLSGFRAMIAMFLAKAALKINKPQNTLGMLRLLPV